jgi:Ca2+-binding RTX toxin-like protein
MSYKNINLTDDSDHYNNKSDNVYIYGLEGSDVINGGKGSQGLFGNEGNDVLSGGLGNDLIDGGADYDTVTYSYAQQGVQVTLAGHKAYAGEGDTDILANVECVTGSQFDDYILGDTGNNKLLGLNGKDLIYGDDGADTIDGGEGNDRLFGQRGGDKVYGGAGKDYIDGGKGDDFLYGGAGNDLLIGGVGVDRLDGGSGFDTASYANATGRVWVDMQPLEHGTVGEAIGDTMTSIERVLGSSFNDLIYGSNLNDTIEGWFGNDFLFGRNGNDKVFGGAGDDLLYGENGNDILEGGTGYDVIHGGSGYDTACYANSYAGVTINLATGVASGGHAVGDHLVEIEFVTGSSHADSLTGNDGRNILDGGGRNDTLVGGAGDDTLIGGFGKDTMAGGADKDVFVFRALGESRGTTDANRDAITDFQQGLDHIDLKGLGNLGFVASEPFHGAAGELNYAFSGANTIVSADVNGDLAADFALEVNGHVNFTAADFLLV